MVTEAEMGVAEAVGLEPSTTHREVEEKQGTGSKAEGRRATAAVKKGTRRLQFPYRSWSHRGLRLAAVVAVVTVVAMVKPAES